ncbi:MAG: exosortase/archaeosortase family protein [Acidobacteriota bacterium]|nr:exosortase/archaeosortase family protein [Acidobacteriota bacterium]
MATSSAPVNMTAGARGARRWLLVAGGLLLAWLFAALYGHILRALLDDWLHDEDYSYGLAVPFVAAYVLHFRWHKLAQMPRTPAHWAGASCLLFSQVTYLFGYFGAEFFLQRTSAVLLGCGIILLLLGARMLRALAFPLVLLQLSIPLPSIIMTRITLPLQLLSSAVAERVLRLCGVTVYRSGNILQMAQQTLNVGEACSGIRSLVSLVTLAVILAGFSRLCWIRRVVLVLSAVPVAIAANALRVSGAGLLSYYGSPVLTTGLWHQFEGWLVFVITFAILYGELLLLYRFPAKETGQ